MKNEPWIDQVYKSQIQAHHIPLDMNHWAEAEAMIIAGEKKKHRRKVIFWLLLFGVGLAIGWFGLKQVLSPNSAPTNSSPGLLPVHDSAEIIPDVASTKDDDCPDLLKSNEDYPNSKNVKRKPELVLAPNSKMKSQSLPTASITDHRVRHIKPGQVQKAQADPNPTPVLQDLNLTLNNVYEEGQQPIPADDIHAEFQISNLEQPIRDLTLNPGKLPVLMEEYGKSPIPVKPIGWNERGVRMTLAQVNGLQLTNPSIAHAGIEYFHQRSIGANMFYGYSFGYKSNFNQSQYAQVISAVQFNGFGSNVQNFGIKPVWMNALFVQGIAGLELKKNRLFLALKPEYIVGARGNVDQLLFKENATGIKDISQAKVSSINKGWLQSGALNRVAWTVSIGYEFRILPRFGIGLQFDHSFRSPFKSLDAQIRQSVAASWNTGLRISYLLK